MRLVVAEAKISVRGETAWLTTCGDLLSSEHYEKALPFYLDTMKKTLEDESLEIRDRLARSGFFWGQPDARPVQTTWLSLAIYFLCRPDKNRGGMAVPYDPLVFPCILKPVDPNQILRSLSMKKIQLPFSDDVVRDLQVGDPVALSGVMVTGRDNVHKWMIDTFIRKTRPPQGDDLEVYEAIRPLLHGSAIYHCGPVVGGLETKEYRFVAAGPTTSIREEPYQREVMLHFKIQGVIGKGGMGPRHADRLPGDAGSLPACDRRRCLPDCPVRRRRKRRLQARLWRP